MPINNPDIATLPRRGADGGMPPSKNPFIVEALATAWEVWWDENYGTLERAIPEAGPFRGSMASMRCDRQLYYGMSDTPESEPMSLAGKYTLWLGQLIHAGMQPIVLAAFPGAAESSHDLRSIGIPGSSHSDIQLTRMGEDGEPILVEIKTTGGFSYKMMATNFKGPAQGPRYGMVMQALMSAAAEGIDKIVIILLGNEPVSPGMAQSYSDSDAGRFMVEWHFTVSELQAHLDAEVARINAMAELITNNAVPDAPVFLPTRRLRDPEYPDGAVIDRPLVSDTPWSVTDPATGQTIDNGTTWMCGYCRWFTKCKKDG